MKTNQISSINEVKNHNVLLIKKTLRSMESGTKNSVSQMTGLSIATCNTILNELAQSKEVLPAEPDVSATVGRPPKSYRFNQDFSYICCVYLSREEGKLYSTYAIINLGGQTICQNILYQEKITLDEIEALLDELTQTYPKIQTISIGIPGYFHNHVVESCGIEELNGIDLVSILGERYHQKIFVENDTNAIALGLYNNALERYDSLHSFVAISFFKNSSLGSGIVTKGSIVHGSSNFAGEILYLPYPDGEIHALLESGREQVIKCAAFALVCYCSILNPAAVVFTGENASSDMIPEIKKLALEYIPENHLPIIRYESNYRDSYMRGLAELALARIFP